MITYTFITDMKNIFIVLACLSIVACKKVDNDLAEQEAMPSINSSYPAQVITGDTLTLTGRLHIDDGGTLTLGGEQAVFISTSKNTFKNLTGGLVKVDTVRFIVTPGMGSGPQPVTVRHGKYSSSGPDITIIAPPKLPHPTDTTLTVTELFGGTIPGFSARYVASGGYLLGDVSLLKDGEMWLQATLDIYHFHDGQIDSYLQAGSKLTLDGEEVTIASFSGAAVDASGTTLYLSLKGNTLTSGYSYLLKKDLASGAITLLNRSSGASVGQPRTNGPIKDLSITATQLKVDAQSRLLFTSGFVGRMAADGMVTTLLEAKGGLGTGKLQYNRLLSYSPDGLVAFIYPVAGGIMSYDLEGEGPIAKVDEGQPLPMVSYEVVADYRFKNRFSLVKTTSYSVEAQTYLGLASGELLQREPGGTPNHTLGAFNLQQAAIYAYAGLERGYDGQAPAVQKNYTGLARYVNFGDMGTDDHSSTHLVAADAAGNVYFIRGGESLRINNGGNMVIQPKIYRLGK